MGRTITCDLCHAEEATAMWSSLVDGSTIAAGDNCAPMFIMGLAQAVGIWPDEVKTEQPEVTPATLRQWKPARRIGKRRLDAIVKECNETLAARDKYMEDEVTEYGAPDVFDDVINKLAEWSRDVPDAVMPAGWLTAYTLIDGSVIGPDENGYRWYSPQEWQETGKAVIVSNEDQAGGSADSAIQSPGDGDAHDGAGEDEHG